METKYNKEDLPFLSVLPEKHQENDNENGNGRLKQSYYNFFFDAENDTGDFLLFNSLSGGFAKVPAANVEVVRRILDDPNGFDCNSPDKKQLFETAKKGGYIVKENVDEKAVLKMMSMLGRYSTEQFHLVILPTMACNFACNYCFQQEDTGIMSLEMQQALVKWVETRLKVANQFQVGWFGGEPLLGYKCIDYLTGEFKRLCDKYDVEYSAAISTNGYLMDEKVIDRVQDWNLRHIQVTLDGPPDIHNTSRLLKNSTAGTYDVLVDHLVKLYEKHPDFVVMLRVNVSEESIKHVPRFFDNLPEVIRQKAHMYMAEIYQCSSFLSADPTENPSEKATPVKNLTGHAMRKKMTEMNLMGAKYRKKFPCSEDQGRYERYQMLPRAGYCQAQYANQFVIGPHGGISKCPVSYQNELKIGQLHSDGTATFNLQKMAMWMGGDFFERKSCSKCKMLPTCMGGCTSATLKYPETAGCAAPIKEKEVTPLLAMLHREGLYGCG